MRAQNLFLILDDRVLISEDTRLVAHQFRQQILMPEDSLLIADDRALVGNDGVLFLDGRLCHCEIPVTAGWIDGSWLAPTMARVHCLLQAGTMNGQCMTLM